MYRMTNDMWYEHGISLHTLRNQQYDDGGVGCNCSIKYIKFYGMGDDVVRNSFFESFK